MNADIIFLDHQRMRFLKYYVIAFFTFILLMITRYLFRSSGLNSQPIGTLVLIGWIITLLVQVFCIIKLALIERDIHRDPCLDEALNSEIGKSLNAQS